MTHISNKTIILSKTSVRSGKGKGFGDECCGDDMEDYEDQFFEDQPYEEEYYEEYYEEFYEQEQKIVGLLKESQEVSLDVLAIKTEIPVRLMSGILLGLELKGVVKALPGKRFGL